MKKILFGIIHSAISTILAMPVFAGTWKQDNVGWWYERDDKSFPKSIWEQIDGSWYYFNENGYMLSNQWFGNYYLGSTGNTNTVVDGYQAGRRYISRLHSLQAAQNQITLRIHQLQLLITVQIQELL